MKSNELVAERARKSLFALHLSLTVAALVFGCVVAMRFAPTPFSDFAAYWEYARDLGLYLKGGVLPLVYRPLRLVGLAPHVASATVNGLSWIALAAALWLPKAWRRAWLQAIATAALIPLAFWWTGFLGIVNSDLPHLALMALGARLALASRAKGLSGIALPALILGSGLSIRMQTVLAAGLTIVLLACVVALARIRPPVRLVAILAGTLVLAGGTEVALRAGSTQSQALPLHSRATLYTGLFATEVGPSCGSWSESAILMAVAELNQPFPGLVWKHLRERPARQLASIIGCKLRTMARYDCISSYWLLASSEAMRAQKPHLERELGVLIRAEDWMGKLLKLLFAALAVGVLGVALSRRSRVAACVASVPWAILLGYTACHAILEIQPRYLMEPVVFGIVSSLYALGFLVADRGISLPQTSPARSQPTK